MRFFVYAVIGIVFGGGGSIALGFFFVWLTDKIDPPKPYDDPWKR